MLKRLVIGLSVFCLLVSFTGCQFWKNPKNVNGKSARNKELSDPPLYPGPGGQYSETSSSTQNSDLLRQAEVLRRNPNGDQEPEQKKPWYKNFGYSSKAAEINNHLGD